MNKKLFPRSRYSKLQLYMINIETKGIKKNYFTIKLL